ncbi:MAG: FCD domain-containing protein [Actinobacteria bacterium]|nr:FCD domain-containing protein [Actinomycetota bacterium]
MASAIDDLPEFLRLDMQFHRALVRASGNVVLITAFQAIYEYHRFSSVFTSQHEGEEERALDHHGKLLTALEKGNAKAGRRILAKHLDYMRKYNRTAQRKAV